MKPVSEAHSFSYYLFTSIHICSHYPCRNSADCSYPKGTCSRVSLQYCIQSEMLLYPSSEESNILCQTNSSLHGSEKSFNHSVLPQCRGHDLFSKRLVFCHCFMKTLETRHKTIIQSNNEPRTLCQGLNWPH